MVRSELIDELLDRWEEMRDRGHDLTAEELCCQHPEFLDEVRRQIAVLRSLAWLGRSDGNDLEPVRGAPSAGQADQSTLSAGAEPIPGYRLIVRLGRGGSGEVWRASGPGGFEVALKFVNMGTPIGAAELRALELVRDVRHPNLLAVFGVWRLGESLAIASELAERTLLDRHMVADGSSQTGIPPDELLDHLEDAARGLDHLHAAGLQHRDVKPQNLLLVGGRVKVGDFGLVKSIRAGAADHTGRMTLAYAAPEFLAGSTALQSDQYSLAVTYCQLRGGRLPFPGSLAEVVVGQLRGQPDLSMLPPAERAVVARALSLDPSQRWPDCVTFAFALRRAASSGQRATRPTGGKKRPLLACGLLLGLLFLPALFTTHSGRSSAPEPELRDRPGQIFCLRGHTAAVTSVGISSSGSVGVSGAEDGTVLVWDLQRGLLLHRLEGHTRPVRSVAISDDGKRVLSGGALGDNTVRLWNVVKGKETGCLRGHMHGVRGVAFLPGERGIVSASFDGTARLWDLESAREVRRFEGLTETDVSPDGWSRQIWSLALSADGRRLACGLRDHSIRLFDVNSGKLLRRLEGHTQFVNAVALSSNGQHVLSGTGDLFVAEEFPRPDRAVRLWDAATGREDRCFTGLVGDVWSVALSANGKQAIVGGADSTVVLLDLDSRQERCRLRGHTSPVASVALAMNRRVALSGGVDGTVRLWRLPD